MAFLSGERITAARLNRLRPTIYSGYATAPIAGPVTNALIPGLSFTVVTTAPNAEYLATWFTDFDQTGPTTVSSALSRLRVNGSIISLFAAGQQEVASDRVTVGQLHNGVLATPGTHTFEVICSLGSALQINTQSTLSVVVTEQA